MSTCACVPIPPRKYLWGVGGLDEAGNNGERKGGLGSTEEEREMESVEVEEWGRGMWVMVVFAWKKEGRLHDGNGRDSVDVVELS